MTSAWDKPQLVNPITVQISDAADGTPGRNLKLDQTKDYILQLPNGRVDATWGLVVWGGHNVVLEGGTFNHTATTYAAQFKNQTGTLWLHNLHFAGPNLTEGIDLQQPGNTTVVMRNILIDELHGSYSTNHADVIQTWSGPQRLLIDGLTAKSDYQGFFLLPNQWDSTTVETIWDFRHVNLHLNGAYAFTLGVSGATRPLQLNLHEVYVDGVGEPRDFAGQGFEDVKLGPPPNGDFVVANGNYVQGVDETGAPAQLPGEES